MQIGKMCAIGWCAPRCGQQLLTYGSLLSMRLSPQRLHAASAVVVSARSEPSAILENDPNGLGDVDGT
jgi:hypothetical protein